MPARGRYGALDMVEQDDKAAFWEEVLQTIEKHGDISSEACWQDLSRVLTRFMLVFQGDQSPLSSWQMLRNCGEMVLRIKLSAKGLRGESGSDALAEFRQFMGEVLEGDAKDETPA